MRRALFWFIRKCHMNYSELDTYQLCTAQCALVQSVSLWLDFTGDWTLLLSPITIHGLQNPYSSLRNTQLDSSPPPTPRLHPKLNCLEDKSHRAFQLYRHCVHLCWKRSWLPNCSHPGFVLKMWIKQLLNWGNFDFNFPICRIFTRFCLGSLYL